MVPDSTLESDPISRLRRPPTKRRLILAALRQQIVTGQFPPGSQLPTRSQLIDRFQASSITVQDALDRLLRDGVVVSRGRNGTFVADRPPHLCQYGIVFPSSPASSGWARYWTALTNEAHAMEADSDRRFKVYHDVNPSTDGRGHRELINDIQTQRLAGVVFTFPPDMIQGSPALGDPSIPVVAIASVVPYPGARCVVLDSQSLSNLALDDLARRGAKRVACLMLPQMNEDFVDHLVRGIESRGMTTQPDWFQGLHYTPATWVSRLARLMVRGRKDERPDGMFIADDNLIEPASAGLVAAGITGPSDLKIVGHANFPWPTPSHLPMRRVGFDIRRTLEAACDLIADRRAGRPTPEFTRIQAQFGDDPGPAVREAVLADASDSRTPADASRTRLE